MALECRCGHGSSSLKSSMVTVPQRHDRSQRRDIAPPHRAETRSLANQSSPFPCHLSLVPCRLSRCPSSPVTGHQSLPSPASEGDAFALLVKEDLKLREHIRSP